MKHIFIVKRSEPLTFDFKSKPIVQVVESAYCAKAATALRVMKEMLEKWPPYLEKPEIDTTYFRYRMRNEEDYSLMAEIPHNNLTTYHSVSIVKEPVI